MDITFHHDIGGKSVEIVKLDGKIAGNIVAVQGGWAYKPKGGKAIGETFPSIHAVRNSLRG